jgi:hypothetical protein
MAVQRHRVKHAYQARPEHADAVHRLSRRLESHANARRHQLACARNPNHYRKSAKVRNDENRDWFFAISYFRAFVITSCKALEASD